MADSKISELAAAGVITGTELVPVVQGGVTVYTTALSLGAATAPGAPEGNFLISGGGAAFTSGLNLTVSAATYSIAGTIYNSVQTDLTSATADPTDPRIDAVVLNSSGNAVILTGTPAPSPVLPVYNPPTQLLLTFYTVDAAATVLPVVDIDVYHENVEYTTSQSGTALNFDGATNPRSGTKCVEATAFNTGNYAQFAAPSNLDLNDYDNLVFYIRNKAAWANNRLLLIQVLDTGALKGVAVTLDNGLFGFSDSNVASYQQIVIPASQFQAGGLPVNQIRIVCAGSGTTMGFYLDDIVLQSGLGAVNDNSRMRWRGTYNATRLYAVNDVVISSGKQYVAIASSVGQTPSTAPLYWEPSGGDPGAGTVTSVGLSAPALFSVSGSPVATIGTLALTYSGTALPVANGGTGITVGTSGGVLGYTASGILAPSGLLDASAIVFGGGAGALPSTPLGLGAATQVLHGNASGTPNWGSVVLTTDVSGVLPIANIATGTPDGTKFVRDDGTLATPAGAGTVTSVGATVPAFLSVAGSPVTNSGSLDLTLSGTALPVASGGTGLTAGTSGGVLAFTNTGVITSSAALTASALLLGGGPGAAPTAMGSLGTTTTLLHGNAGGAPTYGAVRLTSDVSETLPVASGGSGAVTQTAYAVLCGGTTGTSAYQSIAGVGTSGQVLTSNGAGALPTMQSPAGGGDALVANPLSQFAATTSAQLAGVISDETGSGLLVFGTSPTLTTPNLGTPSALVLTNATGAVVAGGGTGVATLTAYAPIFGGTTATGPVQSGTVGTSGQVLTSNGAGALPTMQALPTPVVVVAFVKSGVPTASEFLGIWAAPSSITTTTFAAAIAGSSGKALTAATAQTDIDVRKNATTAANGTSVGTVRWAAAGTVPTFIAASPISCTGGTDWLTFWAPATPDATLADFGVSLYGTR